MQRLKPSVPILLVRFKMGSFRPFIPGVHEQQSFVADEHTGGFVQLFFKIHLECLRAGINEAIAPYRLPRRVVPTRKNCWISLIRNRGPADGVDDGSLIVVQQPEEIVPDRDGTLGRGNSDALWRKLHAGIEPEFTWRWHALDGFHAFN